MIVGVNDHFVTMRVSAGLKYAVCGHSLWLHGHGELFKKSFIYVPRGTIGLHLGFMEPDRPQRRRFILRAPDGAVLFDGMAQGGLATKTIKFDVPGKYDDGVMVLEVSDGAGDYM